MPSLRFVHKTFIKKIKAVILFSKTIMRFSSINKNNYVVFFFKFEGLFYLQKMYGHLPIWAYLPFETLTVDFHSNKIKSSSIYQKKVGHLYLQNMLKSSSIWWCWCGWKQNWISLTMNKQMRIRITQPGKHFISYPLSFCIFPRPLVNLFAAFKLPTSMLVCFFSLSTSSSTEIHHVEVWWLFKIHIWK